MGSLSALNFILDNWFRPQLSNGLWSLLLKPITAIVQPTSPHKYEVVTRCVWLHAVLRRPIKVWRQTTRSTLRTENSLCLWFFLTFVMHRLVCTPHVVKQTWRAKLFRNRLRWLLMTLYALLVELQEHFLYSPSIRQRVVPYTHGIDLSKLFCTGLIGVPKKAKQCFDDVAGSVQNLQNAKNSKTSLCILKEALMNSSLGCNLTILWLWFCGLFKELKWFLIIIKKYFVFGYPIEMTNPPLAKADVVSWQSWLDWWFLCVDFIIADIGHNAQTLIHWARCLLITSN